MVAWCFFFFSIHALNIHSGLILSVWFLRSWIFLLIYSSLNKILSVVFCYFTWYSLNIWIYNLVSFSNLRKFSVIIGLNIFLFPSFLYKISFMILSLFHNSGLVFILCLIFAEIWIIFMVILLSAKYFLIFFQADKK